MSFLVYDLETIPDPRLPPPEPKRCNRPILNERQNIDCDHIIGGCPVCGQAPDVFLPPSFHQIVALGYARVSDTYELEEIDCMVADPALRVLAGPVYDTHIAGCDSEANLLTNFTEHLDAKNPTLVGWNSRGFDSPVVAARCLALGIPFPWYYRGQRNGPRYRYSDAQHFDVKDFLGDHGGARSASLDAVAKSIGLPGKVGVDGSMVAGMVAAGELKAVADYCACDAAQTTGVFFRMQYVRGILSLKGYQDAAHGLVAEIVKNPRLVALRGGIDAARFWLEAL